MSSSSSVPPIPGPPPTTPCEQCPKTGIAQTSNSCRTGHTNSPHNSVLLSTGQFSFRLPLLSISSVGGMGWDFALNYLSGTVADDVVGMGFEFPQSLRLEAGLDYVELLSGDHTAERFNDAGSGNYEPADDNNTRATLTRTGSGASEIFTLRSAEGATTIFYGFDSAIDTPGRIQSITNRQGNSQTLTWTDTSGINQLTSVTDSYGRTIAYRYYGAEQGHRLREIEDFLGRKLNFQYDELGHLVAVVTPSIEKAAPGNTFPGGTAYVFQYDVDNPLVERQNDLIRIWYPNQTAPYLDAATRTVDVDEVYANATPRYRVAYEQDPMDENFGRVVEETVGDPDSDIGGTYTFEYVTSGLTPSIFTGDPRNQIVFETTVTDRNGNRKKYGFNARQMAVLVEQERNRNKISIPSTAEFPSYITWTQYNIHNQPVLVIYPEGNTVESTYSDGMIDFGSGPVLYPPRVGLLEKTTHKPGNTYGIPSRPGSNGQTELTQRFFYDPLFNQPCAVIERRGNPIDGDGTYFTPQNGGTTPTDADRSRYATITYRDYQKNQTATVTGNAQLQAMLGLNASQIGVLISYVDNQLKATDGSGGIPAGFEMNLGDINGDGTGDGASSTLPAARIHGDPVKIKHPSVRLIGSSSITTQVREELFTTNDRGQTTTHTDPEGNLTVYTRYPYSDPEGDGRFIAPGLGNKQYGYLREVHVDADPLDVLSLVGADGDLVDFIPGKITRTNTPGVYQDLVTRYEGDPAGTGGAGCSSCGAYDGLGNALAVTDPRGFTTRYQRNELGEIFRTTAPQPYLFQTEFYFDANRNTVRVDTEDQVVRFDSDDPTSACYAQFTPSGSGGTAHVPMKPGPGGSVRPGWFTNLYTFDLLDNKIEEDIDATGSNPSSLITSYQYDANQNLILITKPAGNTVAYDYDERNLRIAERVGDAPDTPAITVTAYDANGNLLERIGPAQRGGSGNWETVTIGDAFGGTSPLVHTGDFVLENTIDGFDRVIVQTDAAGNTVHMDGETASYVFTPSLDPDGRVIWTWTEGPVGGATPTNRFGTDNEVLSSQRARFDEAGRQYEAQQDVFLAAGTTLPSGRSVTHTGGGLAANSTATDHTGTVTLTAGGSSYVLTRTVHDRSGRPVETIHDNTAINSVTYDGANRKIQEVDPLGNQIDYLLDAGGNSVLVTRTEKCTITAPVVEDEIFRTAMAYDALSRLVLSAEQGADGLLSTAIYPCGSDAVWPVQPSALISRFGYDSRGNQTLTIDPKFNTTITVYDGASRSLQTQQHLRAKGEGQNPPEANQTFLPSGAGCITTTMTLDGNGRLTQLVDDRGNPTRYTYDTLDHETVLTFQDGSTRERTYNTAGDVIEYKDENGSVFTNTFDALGRKTAVSISLASGVVGTTAQSFQFDGLGRNTFARDSVSSTHADVTFVFDSLSRSLEESQVYGGDTRNVTNSGFTSYPVSQFTFPQGRQITNAYDLLYRRTLVEETSGGADIAAWKFFGPGRVAEVVLGNGLIQTFMNNDRTHSAVQSGVSNPTWGNQSSDRLGYDGAGRPITKRFLAGGVNGSTQGYNNTTSVVGFTTSYDQANNKFYERALHAENRGHLYQPFHASNQPMGGYDSINRLRQYQRGTLSSTGGPGNLGGGSIATPITLANTNELARYELDGLGNWRRFVTEPVGGSETTQVRQHNGLNAITRIDSTPFTYDGIAGASNGNLANDGTLKYEWDALNRLKVVKRVSDNATIGAYTYDAMNRRIRMVITNGGLFGTVPNGTTDCLYQGWRCVEERDGSNDPTKQYIWGIYLDELIQQKNITALNNFGTNALMYPLQDLLYRTTALADSAGVLREAYDYDAYGNTLIFRNSGSPPSVISWNDSDTQAVNPTCHFLFTGQRFDAESGNYYYKLRYYTPRLGRFNGRDPIEYFGGELNLYSYAGNSSINFVDPHGDRFVGLPCSACLQSHTKCTWKNSGLYAICVGQAPLTGEIGCAALCAWLAAPTAGAAFAICFIACSGGVFAWWGFISLPKCDLAWEERNMRCGNLYNQCAFSRPRGECCTENWRPD